MEVIVKIPPTKKIIPNNKLLLFKSNQIKTKKIKRKIIKISLLIIKDLLYNQYKEILLINNIVSFSLIMYKAIPKNNCNNNNILRKTLKKNPNFLIEKKETLFLSNSRIFKIVIS